MPEQRNHVDAIALLVAIISFGTSSRLVLGAGSVTMDF
jgi:hypothetical protein